MAYAQNAAIQKLITLIQTALDNKQDAGNYLTGIDVSLSPTSNGAILTVNGESVELYNGNNGFSPTVRLVSSGNILTITVTDINGTQSATLRDGIDGVNGFSPVVTLTKENNVVTLSIEDATSTQTVTFVDGSVAYKSFPKAEQSGSFIHFVDGADNIPVAQMVTDINPVQSGSGVASISNIRAINPVTDAIIYTFGKNILQSQPSYTYSTVTVLSNFVHNVTFDSITISFTATNAQFSGSASGAFIDLREEDGTHHYLAPRNFSNSSGTKLDTANTSYTGRFSATVNNITFKSIICYYESNAYANWTSDALSNFQAEFGSQLTDYEPVNTQTIDVNLATIGADFYGGTLDVTTGELKAYYAYKSLNGTESWNQTGTNPYWYLVLGSGDLVERDVAICSHFVDNPNITSSNSQIGFRSYYSSGAGNSRIIIRPDASLNITNTTQFKSWLAGQVTAQTPVQVAYKLRTPTTYQLTPEEVNTLLGENNMVSTNGNLSVIYRCDTTILIAEQCNKIKKMIAGVEVNYIATSNYVSGNIIIVQDTLYHITDSIANGAAIIPGTNCIVTTIANEIASGGSGSGGTSDYTYLSNKPQINDVTLSGNKSLTDLGIHNVPSGGTSGYVLKKSSNSDYDMEWGAESGGSSPSPSDATPQDLNTTASAGTSTSYARGDHVHKMPSASDIGAIATPSSPSSGDYLTFNGSAWVASTLPLYNGGVS